ncbi:efflux RND transporter permease subunit [Euhalothece natronophila Z-M001]|uniref:Efflux RND transporter permease subunit n=1 Tax=Euhalothece natronophila Z-M001 TaxID=522448 RepID=A0A5B8NMH7_9CHRO|nr:efflux RND transporter permease subunit [Euhalothece natronophila]QDZ40492.1 efflux RND transporter permease subunit [Euhalothece natronophila Z-M001]
MTGFSISAIAIRRHIGTLAITLAVLVVGGLFLLQIPVDLLPSITYPRIGVRISTPGVSPQVAVEEVAKPVEEALRATEGVTQIYSQTREGRVRLDLYFEPGEDVDQALNETTAAFNRSQGQLPDVVEDPRIFKYDPSQLPVYEFALQSDSLQDVDLRVFAEEELARELNVVSGVASVDVSGGVQQEVRVELDPIRLQGFGLGLNEVLNELRDRNVDVSGGRLSGGSDESLTRTIGQFSNTDEIRNLSFTVGENEIPLREFAEVIDGTEEQRVFVTLNQSPAIKLSVQKQPTANTLNVIDEVKQRIEQMREAGSIPDDMMLVTTLDESVFIRNAVNNVATAGITGAVLASVAVLLFLGSLRQTLIIIIGIPLATFTAIVLMRLFGLSLNVFSLGGLALGVGIVVDNAIVMLETIAEGVGMTPGYPAAEEKASPSYIIQQAETSSRTIESALLASTSTNLVAVVPFLLIGGFFSLLFNELILTISFAVASSMLIALTVVPMLASRLLAIPRSSGVANFWFLRRFNEQFQSATRLYQGGLKQVLRFRVLVIAMAFFILGGGSFWLAGDLDQEIVPRINTGQAQLNVQFPDGTTLAQNRRVMELVDETLLAQPETKSVFTTAGGGLFGSNVSENVLRGSSTIELPSGTGVDSYISRTEESLEALNLVDTRVRMRPGSVRGINFGNSPTRGDLDVIVQGSDRATLQEAGEDILEALEDNVENVRFQPDADPPQSEIQIRPNWERAREFGLTVNDIGEALQTTIDGAVPTELQRSDRLVDIRVQLPETTVNSISRLENVPLLVGDNRSLQLSDIATVSRGEAPGEIQRINQREVYLIEGNLEEGATLGSAIAQINSVLSELDLPDGVSIAPSSAEDTNEELQNSLQLLGGLAAFLVFVVMAVQYNSFIDPLVIMLTVPLALAGGIIGLYLTETPVGATVLVGAILLVGIVVNNAIVMVEFANQIYNQQWVTRRQAILQAAPQRLRPILMTTITTVLGMFPLALGLGEGSEFLQPLGIVVFSGLSLATFLTLFIIPCFYTLLHDLFSAKRSESEELKPALPEEAPQPKQYSN